MLVSRVMQLVVGAAMVWGVGGASASIKLCGRTLGEIMSRVCHAYNSPSWDLPTVEHPSGARRRRQISNGIADECCTIGCTWEQLSEYCAVSAHSEPTLVELEEHMIADRSAEAEAEAREGERTTSAPAQADYGARRPAPREVGRGSGYGRRRRRCWCRRKRRSGRRRAPMGNMGLGRSATRAAPVVGTVSPLLTWGRTLNTDLPPAPRDQYAYLAVYT